MKLWNEDINYMLPTYIQLEFLKSKSVLYVTYIHYIVNILHTYKHTYIAIHNNT